MQVQADKLLRRAQVKYFVKQKTTEKFLGKILLRSQLEFLFFVFSFVREARVSFWQVIEVPFSNPSVYHISVM